ncbi:MAG: HEAT repeat domain-containing protein [Candidatus Altiarchaeota archaeon]|nr:HEAT repeat domain-containing protein [Candidatus Altiarchaeota archaeon]
MATPILQPKTQKTHRINNKNQTINATLKTITNQLEYPYVFLLVLPLSYLMVEREKLKPDGLKPPEEPRIIEKVQPRSLKTPVSRSWLNKHFNVNLDEMSASSVAKMGWTVEDVVELEVCVPRWNEALGASNFHLMPFKEVGSDVDDTRSRTRSEEGVLYLNMFGPTYLHCPDVFVAHEGGHYLEKILGKFKSSSSMREARNRYRTPGLMQDTRLKLFPLIPPAGVSLDYDAEVLSVFSGLEGHIGYNFRQINCDSMAFQKYREAKVALPNMVNQYLTYMELEQGEMQKHVTGGYRINIEDVPFISRFTAGAFAMSVIARDILQDAALERRAQAVCDNFLHSLKDESKSNLSAGDVKAATVLVDTYLEHFISSLNMRELFEKQSMGIHLERLDPVKSDAETRVNELRLLGRVGDQRFLNELVARTSDEDRKVRLTAVEALCEMGGPKAVKALEGVIYGNPDVELRGHAAFYMDNANCREAVYALGRLMNTQQPKGVISSAAFSLWVLGNPPNGGRFLHEAVEQLVPSMEQREDEFKRKEAINAMSNLAYSNYINNPRVVPALMDALNADSEVRKSAIRVLGFMRVASAHQQLARIMNEDPDQEVKEAAAWAMRVNGTTTGLEALAKKLDEATSKEVKDKLLSDLNGVAHPAVVRSLVRMLQKEDNPYFRERAAWALKGTHEKYAIQALVTARESDSDKSVRLSAISSLGDINDPETVPAIIKIAQEDPEDSIRCRAIDVLGRMGDKRANEALINIINDEKQSMDARQIAVGSLGQIGGPDAKQTLINALQSNHQRIRMEAARSLGWFPKDEGVIKPIIKAMQEDPDEDVREFAARTLGESGSERAEKLLIQAMLNDPSHFVRDSAAFSLGDIGFHSSISAIEEAKMKNLISASVAQSAIKYILNPSKRL